MGPNALFSSILSMFFLATLASASTFLSDNIFNKSEVSHGRALIEDEPLKVCSIDFEKQNYTILTSKCKRPNYSPKMCCEAFKQFACPFAEYINEMSTDCAPAMFYYINLHGHYPQGLFANNCREGPEGLDCTLIKPVMISHSSIHHGKRTHKNH
ncbi:hypothetical protein Lal_00028962 [Lupinus albus]|uniref:GPI-anchored protein LLG1-like domain-containing protein n=1 Tax=Lupinus albus TaxID=3870 RepID=A0A6A4NQM4_LUPAL|nr:hypothetical protein Lalb_Chr19g0135281 [Lupinus albus]KAF1885073.1 hypothetical protein Lal_00028962 [Lupinus albus]